MATDYKREKFNIKSSLFSGKNTQSKLGVLVSRSSEPDSGFTMIETIVVAIMVGLLIGIAAPGWVGFVNRQRVNKANDAILSALQQANRAAVKDKRNYSVSFRNRVQNNQIIPEFSVHQGATPTNWQRIGGDLELKPGQIALLTNLTNTNQTNANGNLNLNYNFLANPQTITFDYLGSLKDANFGGQDTDVDRPGLKIAVATPNGSNSALANDLKRCVIVKTLLGSMITEKDAQCN